MSSRLREALWKLVLAGVFLGVAIPHAVSVAATLNADQVNEQAAAPEGYAVVERGENFAVYEKAIPLTNNTGVVSVYTNRFTLLETGLHYFENGEWKSSEDVIESFPEGAVARRGPNKVIFSPDLNSAAPFDMATSDGQRLRGGVRSIQLTDTSSGRSLVLAGVKQSAPGELLPPNRVIYRDAFDGLAADVLYVWKHGSFSQNVILKQQPALPAEMNPVTTRLEVVTEFVEAPEPVLNRSIVRAEGQPDLVDDATIGFGQMLAVRGKAFPVSSESVNLGGWSSADVRVPVAKQWHQLSDGRRFVIESVAWSEIEPLIQALPTAQTASKGTSRTQRVADARQWPARITASPDHKPIEVASVPYAPKGFLVDVDLIGSASSYTFLAGETYYIENSFSVGPGATTVQPGCVVKYGSNAYLLLYGSISFPDSIQTPVFTSKDDNSFGNIVTGSTGNPTYAAAKALWIYYVTFVTEIRNARIRWAQRGVQYDANPGVDVNHTLKDSLWEKCQTGVYLNLPEGKVTLTNTKKCTVTTPITGSGDYSGSITDSLFCTDKSFEGINNSFTDNFGVDVPDTMGAVGPSHFVELLNGKIAVFDKNTGQRIEEALSQDFFSLGGQPRGTVDPRITYDHASQRWVACGITQGANVTLAVSATSNPTGLLSTWTKYLVPIDRAGSSTDFVTLGVDTNGIYLAVYHYHFVGFTEVNDGNTVAGIKKPEIYQGNFSYSSQYTSPAELNTVCIQPAFNFDSPPLGGYAWFVAKGPADGQETSYRGGPVYYRRLYWNNNVVAWQDSSWLLLSEPTPTYRNYFDLDTGGISAPQGGGSTRIGLQLTGSRLMMALVRNGFLWTCHHVGLDGTDGDYDGTETGSTVDRSAAQWLKLQLNAAGTPLTYSTHSRVYDNASTTPYYFYMPSLVVNAANDMVMGFSGSRSSDYIGAFYTGRRANGTTPTKPILVQAGKGYYNLSRWGDYSHTTLDPDGTRFWTVQEYAEKPGTFPIWETWIMSVQLGP